MNIDETDEIKLNQLEVVCTFCQTGTRPEDEDQTLGKRQALGESDGSSDGDDDDEEERIYAGLNGSIRSEVNSEERQKTHLHRKFKLIKKSEDDIETDFKEPTTQHHVNILAIVSEADSELDIAILHSDERKIQNGQSICHAGDQPSQQLASSVQNSAEIPLKEKDHNQELLTQNGGLNIKATDEKVKQQVPVKLKSTINKSSDNE